MTTTERAVRRSALATTLGLLFKTAWWALAVATPALGVWASSSLAAYRNGPRWLAVAAGLLLFPVVPLGWEAWARWRRRPGARVFLTVGDRVTLRTLALNVAFLAALLATHPQSAFAALSTRGDWMLDGSASPHAPAARRALFRLAGELQWLYDLTRENPFRAQASARTVRPEPERRPPLRLDASPSPGGQGDPRGRPARWPLPAALHPLIASLPASVETSPEAVARYLQEREPDVLQRLKAVHDYVADRVVYDVESYRARRYPPQDAATVFRTRRGVCAGYAALFEAMARAAGLDAVMVVGDARTRPGSVEGESHAWNAVKVEGLWHLVDTTWDAGSVGDQGFQKRYRTEYFLTPPEVFGVDHYPEQPAWQLRREPLSRGEFFRQAMMRPAFYAQGLGLVRPDRSQVSASGSLEVVLTNPRGVDVSAAVSPSRGGDRTPCEVTGGARVRVRCAFAARETYTLWLFTAPTAAETHWSVGSFEVTNGG